MKIKKEDIDFGLKIFDNVEKYGEETFNLIINNKPSYEFYEEFNALFDEIKKEWIENETQRVYIPIFFFLRVIYSANGKNLPGISRNRFKKIIEKYTNIKKNRIYSETLTILSRLNNLFALSFRNIISRTNPSVESLYLICIAINVFSDKINDMEELRMGLNEIWQNWKKKK